ncbi:MAG: FMN-binding negative transcriptional regulator [Aestuariivirga sp.]
MYLPPAFREDRLDVQQGLIRKHPFGLLVTVGRDGPIASPLPFVLDSSASTLGTLRGHLARGNAQWKESRLDINALVIFQGPDVYVTPSWYETKRETGKVVPTWNYATVQARGKLKVMDDAGWLAAQISALTNQMEGKRAKPWAVSDAPADYIQSQIKGIVGLEIEIAEIEGKWKVSQNRPMADRRGVADGLAEGDGSNSAMIELVKTYGGL